METHASFGIYRNGKLVSMDEIPTDDMVAIEREMGILTDGELMVGGCLYRWDWKWKGDSMGWLSTDKNKGKGNK